MATLELKKGLSDAKAGKPIYFAFVKGKKNRLIMSKTVLRAATEEVSDARKECEGSKIFTGKCGGLDEKGKVLFYVQKLGEDKENTALEKLIEKEAAAAKVTLKVKATAAPSEEVPEDGAATGATKTAATTPADTAKLYYESRISRLEGEYAEVSGTPNAVLKAQLETLHRKTTEHASAGEYLKANEAMAVLGIAIGKARATLPGAVPIDAASETPKVTGPADVSPVGVFDARLKEVQTLLGQLIKTPGVDPAELKEFQKLLKQALVHKGQKDYEAGSDLLSQILVKTRVGIGAAANKPKQVAPKDESTEAKVERVLKERAAKQERDKLVQRIEVDSIIAAMPREVDLIAVRAIMTEHAKKVPDEEKAFAGVRFFDDITLIKEEPKRVEKLKGIQQAMAASRDRKIRMAIELGKLPTPTNDSQQEATDKARGLWANMTAHIPDWWQANWSDDFQERIRVLSLDPQKKKEELAKARSGFSKEEKDRQKEVFTKAVDPRSLKGIEAHDSYFDQLTSAPSADELQEMAEVTRGLLKRARQIRDAGGTLADVKEALAHVPETWWPAELLDYMQAWRKVERELLQERVRERFKAEEDTTLDTVEGAIGFVAAALELYAGTEWMKAPEVTGVISGFVSGISDGFGLGKGWGELVVKQDFSKFNGKAVEEFADKALETVKTFCETLASLKEKLKGKLAIPDESFLAAKVIPGLSIAAAGIDLFLAIKKLGEHAAVTHKTRRMISKAEEAWSKGQDEDGGAFVRALKNERTGRGLQLGKDSVDVTKASLDLAGSIGEVSGMGTAAGTAIKITGKVIEYGGKVVFTGIEWGMANTAKDLIREAQAGNPVARIQIMEDCNLYAKMYIAILVRDGHPLGRKFIEERGLEEGDLTDAASLKILREAMLTSADQKDETKVKDNLAAAMVEGLGAGGALSLGAKVAELATTIKNKYVDRNAGTYDPAWKHNSSKVSLLRDAWDATKREAFTKGLHDELTGIGDALDKVQATLPKVDVQNKARNTKENLVAAIAALKDVLARLHGYCPMTVPHGEKKEVVPHKGMTLYVVEMKRLVISTLNQIDGVLVSRGDRQPDWKTDKTKVDPDEWKAAWKDAVSKAMLADQDQGVEAALRTFKAAMDDKAIGNAANKQAQREAQLKARDKAIELVKAFDACWAGVGDCQGMRDYIERLKAQTAQAAQSLQRLLFEVGWWDNPADSMSDQEKFSSAGWKKVWTDACQEGVVQQSKGEAGVGAALAAYESSKLALDKVLGTDPKRVMAARQELSKACTNVFAAASKFVADQKEAVKGVLDYAGFLVKTAQQGTHAMAGLMADVAFKETPGFDAPSWKANYQSALAAGALPEARGLAGNLESALQAYTTTLANLTKEKRPKEKRVLAQSVKAKLGELQTAVNKMNAAEGYAEHRVMGKYLSGLETEVGKRLQDKAVTDAIEGAAAVPGFGPQVFSWTKQGWLVAKHAAVDAGLFDPANTGFTGILESAQSSYEAWKQAKPDAKTNTAAAARKNLGKVITMAQQFAKATANANLKKFFKDGIAQAEARVAEMKND